MVRHTCARRWSTGHLELVLTTTCHRFVQARGMDEGTHIVRSGLVSTRGLRHRLESLILELRSKIWVVAISHRVAEAACWYHILRRRLRLWEGVGWCTVNVTWWIHRPLLT